MKILFIIDELEYKYFEFNKLVTNFWLNVEFLKRGHKVFVATKNMLNIRNNKPFCFCANSFFNSGELFKENELKNTMLNDFDVIFFRPDPPVDINYINATYILSMVQKDKTLVLNSVQAIRDKNEKLYINDFPEIAPDNIVTSNTKLIREFLKKHREIVIKPLNRCFSSGVFYLFDGDKNTNTIINTATDNGKTTVMVQEFLPGIKEGDKRLIFICGEILDYCVQKVATNDDFKFNEHCDANLKLCTITPEQKAMEGVIAKKLMDDGVIMAGLDVIANKVIEINITSPCFFIKEINSLYGINLEKIITDKLENYIFKTLNEHGSRVFSKC